MQHFELKGQIRKIGNKAVIKAFRRQGLIPCNLYGYGVKNILFTVDEKELKGITNTPAAFIVDLVFDNGEKQTAILHELQYHPVEERCLHVDFLAVDEKRPIAINVPIYISGHAKGVQKGGKFTQSARELRVSALMKNLPDSVTVDITSLDLDKKIKAGEIKLENAVVLTDKDVVICSVRTTRNVDTSAASTEEAAAETPAEGEAAAPAAE